MKFFELKIIIFRSKDPTQIAKTFIINIKLHSTHLAVRYIVKIKYVIFLISLKPK